MIVCSDMSGSSLPSVSLAYPIKDLVFGFSSFIPGERLNDFGTSFPSQNKSRSINDSALCHGNSSFNASNSNTNSRQNNGYSYADGHCSMERHPSYSGGDNGGN